jgi:hypothetical protein
MSFDDNPAFRTVKIHTSVQAVESHNAACSCVVLLFSLRGVRGQLASAAASNQAQRTLFFDALRVVWPLRLENKESCSRIACG